MSETDRLDEYEAARLRAMLREGSDFLATQGIETNPEELYEFLQPDPEEPSS